MIGPIASWTRKSTYLYVKGTKANQETADVRLAAAACSVAAVCSIVCYFSVAVTLFFSVPVTPFLQVSGLLSVKATLQHRYLNMVQDLRGR